MLTCFFLYFNLKRNSRSQSIGLESSWDGEWIVESITWKCIYLFHKNKLLDIFHLLILALRFYNQNENIIIIFTNQNISVLSEKLKKKIREMCMLQLQKQIFINL